MALAAPQLAVEGDSLSCASSAEGRLPCSAKTEELLNDKLGKAQGILALADLCKKYEMDYEHLASRRVTVDTAAFPGGQVRSLIHSIAAGLQLLGEAQEAWCAGGAGRGLDWAGSLPSMLLPGAACAELLAADSSLLCTSQTESSALVQVLLDKSEIDLEAAKLRKDIKAIESLLEASMVGRFANGYLAGQPGDTLCVIRSVSRVAL